MDKGKIWNEAKKTVGENSRLKTVVSRALEKLKSVSQNSDQFKSLSAKIQVLVRMVKAHIAGSYRSFSPRTLLLIVFALLYFIIPTDAIPDFIPALGFTDDLSILYFVWKQIAGDISSFLQWEKSE